MMRKAEHGRHGRPIAAERRVLRAALVLGAAVVLGAGATPMAHGASAAETVSTVSPLATVSDPDAERAAVELLKATYFNDVDTKNWLALRQLFAPDAVVDTTGSLGPYFPNRDSFLAFTSLTLSSINTRHQGYDPQIGLTSDTTASAVWTMQDRLSLAGLVTIHGYGHYTDNYEEVDGQWRITYSKLTRTGFALEFPAFQNFATGLTNAYQSGGPVAALLYVGPAIANIPVSAVTQLVGAIASNFGGPPAKAQQITVPPGSTGVTTEPPGVTTVPSTASAATSSTKTFTLRTSVATTTSSGSSTTPFAADAVGSTAKPPKSIGPDATESAGTGKPRMSTVGAPATSPKTHDDSGQDAASSATKTTADKAAGNASRAATTVAGHDDSTVSSSTSHGAGHNGADDAEAGSSSSGGSQH
jgi:SnoaL-like domain